MTDDALKTSGVSRRAVLRNLAAGGGLMLLNRVGQAAAPAATGTAGPVATLTSGKVRGYINNGISVFKGIPYGEDTAKYRFKAPVPVARWEGIKEALEFGYMPAQAGNSSGGAGGDTFFPPAKRGTKGATASEDCLNLNVWTPQLRDGKKRPVMVYFHGGAYNGGSVNLDLYDGTRLCQRGDVVVVTVNGRLNGFGFLYLADLCGAAYAESGNVGMLDLVLALQWVRDNIAGFGGDPANVLIFGQSGGGAKCATLMGMPAAKGLFHRVITMSGQQITGRTREHANDTAKTVLANLNIAAKDIDKINALTMAQINAGLRGGNWTPVVDGKVLPRDPFAPDASPLSANIPMMMGNTRDETTTLIGGSNEALFTLTWDTVAARIGTSVQQYLGDLKPDDIVAQYRKLYPDYSPSDVFFAATTAARSWKSMLVEVEARAKQNVAPLFVYELDWRTPVDGGKWRAGHTLDIPLAFDNQALGVSMIGNGAEAQKMCDIVADTYIAFARNGNPDNGLIPHWPRYDLPKRSTLVFNLKPAVVDDARGDERRIFEKIAYVQPGT